MKATTLLIIVIVYLLIGVLYATIKWYIFYVRETAARNKRLDTIGHEVQIQNWMLLWMYDIFKASRMF